MKIKDKIDEIATEVAEYAERERLSDAQPSRPVEAAGKFYCQCGSRSTWESGHRFRFCPNCGNAVDWSAAPDPPAAREPSGPNEFRVGKSIGTTIYRIGDEQPLAWVPDNPTLAANIVELLNAAVSAPPADTAPPAGYYQVTPAFTLGGAGRVTVKQDGLLEAIQNALALSPVCELQIIEVPSLDQVQPPADTARKCQDAYREWCSNCQYAIKGEWTFCPGCGSSFVEVPSPSTDTATAMPYSNTCRHCGGSTVGGPHVCNSPEAYR